MTKTELIHEIAKNTELTQKQAAEFLDKTLDCIVEGLKTDETVQLTGFGTFKSHEVTEHEGHNPKNPTVKIMIPTYSQVSFTSGKGLKDAINQ
mgnify:CR=1 FL=1